MKIIFKFRNMEKKRNEEKNYVDRKTGRERGERHDKSKQEKKR